MELLYYGGNCLKISTRKAALIIDGNISALGGKDPARPDDIALFTGGLPADYGSKGRLVISDPGEYEISGVSISGIAAQAFSGEGSRVDAIIYKIVADDLRLAVVGHINPKLTDAQLEALGTIDVLCLPVGGSETLNGYQALEVIKEIEPKLVIPTFYKEAGLKYPAEVTDLATALKALGMEPAEKTAKLKLKAGELSETTKLIVLEKTS